MKEFDKSALMKYLFFSNHTEICETCEGAGLVSTEFDLWDIPSTTCLKCRGLGFYYL